MKLHPLHSAEFIADFIKSTGEYFDTERCTGRSTAIALEVIAKAIRSPHQWVHIVDHHDTHQSNEHLTSAAARIATTLGLKHLTFRGPSVCFGIPPTHAPLPRCPTVGPTYGLGPKRSAR